MKSDAALCRDGLLDVPEEEPLWLVFSWSVGCVSAGTVSAGKVSSGGVSGGVFPSGLVVPKGGVSSD